ncbi:MAG: hypothetical protein U9R22_03100 [Pseudomonadota bacterium]|nr:hypothetical protein [Pseudomonadota bacterium]
MDAISDLYRVVRERYPEITVAADRVHGRTWGEPAPEFAYSWFESLANALNGEMNKGVDPGKYLKLFSFFSHALQGCSPEVKECIDVSFVENLFWRVPGDKAEPYWARLPASLKALYTGFHGRAPV